MYSTTYSFDSDQGTGSGDSLQKALPKEVILAGQRIISSSSDSFASTPHSFPEQTPGTNIGTASNGILVVLTGNSSEYPHGILGDTVESKGFSIYRGETLLHTYTLPAGSVFETLRPLIADIVPEHPGEELILTTSDREKGAKIQVFSLEGELLGESQAIGKAFRWLHILAAAPFYPAAGIQLAIVKTPHIGGILELYAWEKHGLQKTLSFPGVSTHKIGSDNLNMAIAAFIDTKPGAELLLPTQNFQNLLLITFHTGKPEVLQTIPLQGSLQTNIFSLRGGDPSIWVGTDLNKLVKLSGTSTQ